MKLLLTGGSGFLGLHVCKQLASNYDEVIIVDIDEYKPEEYPQNVRFIKGDIRDLDLMKKIGAEADIIVHAAAALPLWAKKDIMEIEIDGTRNVLEAALANKIKRVCFISSTAVYGVPKKHPIYEDDPLVGVGPYGIAKIEAEKICEKYRDKLCVPIIRPKTFIGPYRLGVFQILYDWVESGKKIPIIGKGDNPYQLLDVRDLVDAIDLSLKLPQEKVNDTFNIGAKEFQTVKEDVQALCDYAKNGARVLPTPAPPVIFFLEIFWLLRVSPLYKWVYGTAHKESFVSVEKAENILEWSPQYSNAQALIDSYKWYLNNKEEVMETDGVTHRVPWKQGILGLIKKFL